jgi:hypothetical protein
MCDAPTVATPDCSERLVAPDVLGSVLGVTGHANCSSLVIRPESAITPADRAVADREFLRTLRNFDSDGAAVTSSGEHAVYPL